MVFSRKRSIPDIVKIKVNNSIISGSHVTKFLGVCIDSKLNWKALTRDVSCNVTRSVNILKTLAHKSWGSYPSTLLLVHGGLIRARLEWAFFSSHNASKSAVKKLNTSQFAALRLILGCFKSTPTNVRLELAGEPSIHYRACKLAVHYLCRSFSLRRHPLIPKLKFLRERIDSNKTIPEFCKSFLLNIRRNIVPGFDNAYRSNNPPCYELPIRPQLLSISPVTDIGKSLQCVAPSNINSTFYSEVRKKWPNHLFIYTSKKRGGSLIRPSVFCSGDPILCVF